MGRVIPLALGVSVMLGWMSVASAAESTSYVLQGNGEQVATEQNAVSTSYALNEGNIGWYQSPAASNSYQIVPPMHTTAAAAASSTTSSVSGDTSGGGRHTGGGYRPRSSSSSSSVASVSSSAPTSGTPATSSPTSSSSSAVSGEPETTTQTEEILGHPAAPERGQSAGMTTTVRFFDGVNALCASRTIDRNLLIALLSLILICLLLLCTLVTPTKPKKKTAKKKKGKAWTTMTVKSIVLSLLLAGLGICSIIFATSAYAAQTVPTKHIYNGRLLNSAGTAITTARSIRFSYWKSADALSGDTTATGAINVGASNYGGWQEVHTVTPNSLGYFSVTLGSGTALPVYANLPASTLLSLFLQVDVKGSSETDTAYEMLDIDSNDSTVDRSGILSVPFASNADTIDEREVGTGSGSIAILGPNGEFAKDVIPGGTNSGSFVIDANNTETSEIALQFGATLGKKLTYDILNSTFKFNANLQVQGNLTVTGLINGINVTQLQSSTGALKAWSGGGLNLNVAYGSYRLNGNITNYGGGQIALTGGATNYVFFGSGGLQKNMSAFPTDESFIPVAEVVTSNSGITSVVDRRALSGDNREQTKAQTFNPSYEKASYQGDGADNVGQLSVTHDNTNLLNFYDWTSTRTSLQDYDILLKVPVTDDFVRWKNTATVNPLTLTYRSTSASTSNNKLDIQVYDTSGIPVTLSGSATGLANTSWTTTQLEFSGSPTWTPGQDMLIRIKPYAKDNYQMHIGALKLMFVELLQE